MTALAALSWVVVAQGQVLVPPLLSAVDARATVSIEGSALTPRLGVAVTPDRSAGLPGDSVSYGVRVSNSGATVTVRGVYSVANAGTERAQLTGYWSEIGRWTTDAQWFPVANHTTGSLYRPPGPAPHELGARLTPIAADGVSYPASGHAMVGTVIESGKEARWRYELEVAVDPAEVGLLLGSATQQVKHVYSVRLASLSSSGWSGEQRELSFTNQLRTQSEEVRDAVVTVTLPDGATRTLDGDDLPGLAVLGGTESVEGEVSGPLPPVAARGASEADADYRQRLLAAVQEPVFASAQVAATAKGEASEDPTIATVDRLVAEASQEYPEHYVQPEEQGHGGEASAVLGPDRTLQADGAATVERRVPLLGLARSGPVSALPAEQIEYQLALSNDGTSAAQGVELADALDAGGPLSVDGAPVTLAAGESATATSGDTVAEDAVAGARTGTARVSWRDANGNLYGPLEASSTTQLLVPAVATASSGDFSLAPALAVSVDPSITSALPGESVSYTTQIRNAGADLTLNGQVAVANGLTATGEVAAYHVSLERRDAGTGRWTAVAAQSVARDGYTPRVDVPDVPALDVSAVAQAGEGTTYPADGDRLLGARIGAAGTGAWNVQAKVRLPDDVVALLGDGAQTSGLRWSAHVELTDAAGAVATHTARAALSDLLATQDAVASDVRATVAIPGAEPETLGAAAVPALSALAPGASATIERQSALPQPAAKGAGESDMDYVARLTDADSSGLRVNATASAVANGTAHRTPDGAVNADAARRLPTVAGGVTVRERLPVLSLVKTGPEAANPGDAVTYRFSLVNTGSQQAMVDSLTDAVDGAAAAPVAGAPQSVAAGATELVELATTVPADREPGAFSDRGELRWRDSAGNTYGPVSDRWIVNVVRALAPTAPSLSDTDFTPVAEATSFLYAATDPVQTGMSAGTIDPVRAAVLRGHVAARDGGALAGVRVSVLDHPEFGETTTRPDGEYYLAVNGGGMLTVRLEKDGYLPVDRQVEVPWNDYAFAEDVALVALDAPVTAVDLSGPLSSMQVAQGGAVSDQDGTRQATLLFQPGTQATMTLPDGSSAPVPELHVRATEYTVGADGQDAMPAPLPPNSGYTYAVEYSVDEAIAADASQVTFSRPVVSYTDNFLGFPAGGAVPAGYYDRDRGHWVAAPNGRVIKILSEQSGAAVLDVAGTGAATQAQLDQLGVTQAELEQLAGLYEPGDSLWRVLVDHFTPWDFNWPYGLPPGAIAPDGVLAPGALDDCYECEGSVIEAENQTLGEAIPLVGTDQQLHYRSDRQRGRSAERTIAVPLSDGNAPIGAEAIELEVVIAGQRFAREFAPGANLKHTFTWDGRDAFGRETDGAQAARITVRYRYPAYRYSDPQQFSASFGSAGAGGFATDRARGTITLGQTFATRLGSARSAVEELGGWSLSSHHRYDAASRTLLLGHGPRRSIDSLPMQADRVVGQHYQSGFGGDGGPASEALLDGPRDIVAAPDGSLYIADWSMRIRRVAPDGRIETIAGNGNYGYSGDGGPALQAQITPNQLALAPDGGVLFTDCTSGVVRRVRLDGIIERVAGIPNTYDYGGDGGPALAAKFRCPLGLAVAADGTIYVGDNDNAAVRRIGTDGTITAFAGTPEYHGTSGDGGPATQALLGSATGITFGPDGSLYVADGHEGRVRRVGTDGDIETVAGNGVWSDGNYRDGNAATDAPVDCPEDVAISPDGRLYISDSCNGHIRAVDARGIITTFGGLAGDARYEGPYPGTAAAHDIKIDEPEGIAIAPDGGLYVTDFRGNDVFRIAPSLPGLQAGEVKVPSTDGAEVYTFDRAGRHLFTRKALTGVTTATFAYDASGRLVSVTDQFGNAMQVERGPTGRPTAIIAPYGQVTALATNGDGYLASVTNPAGEATRLSYDERNLLSGLRLPGGALSRFEHDDHGRLLKDTAADGSFKTLSVVGHDSGRTVTVATSGGLSSEMSVTAQADGGRTRTMRNAAGELTTTLRRPDATITQTQPDGTVITTKLAPDPRFGMTAPVTERSVTTTPSGRTRTITRSRSFTPLEPADPLAGGTLIDTVTLNGRTSTRRYDALTRRLTVTSPAGRASTVEYDARDLPVMTQTPGGQAIAYRYDTRGKLVEAGPAGRSTVFGHSGGGELIASTDPLGRTARFAHDLAGRVFAQTDPAGAQTTFAFDSDGQLTAVAPPSRDAHTFSYTNTGRPESYEPPALHTGEQATSFGYDGDGDLRSVRDPDGRQTLYGYDGAGRLDTVAAPHGVSDYMYNAQTGNVTAVERSGERLLFTHDGELMTSETASGTVAATVTRTFGDDFGIASETVNGDTVAFSYDADGLLTQAGAMGVTLAPASGRMTATQLGALTSSYGWNTLDELTHLDAAHAGSALLATDYQRDPLGRITHVTETIQGATRGLDYEYDPAGRLSRVTRDGQSWQTYSYDANGNRTSITEAGQPARTASFDAQDRLTRQGTVSYAYNRTGQLTQRHDSASGQSTGYDYDAAGNLRAVELPDGHTVEYVIDAFDRRVAVRHDGQLERGFVWGEADNPIAELNPDGSTRSRYIYGTSMTVPDYVTRAGRTYKLITDNLGSVRLVVDADTGEVAQRLDYDPYGRVTMDTNPGFQPFGYTGGLYDHRTGLLRLGARDYDPDTGRFTAKDPIGFAGGDTGLYNYVAGDPVNITDPSGLLLDAPLTRPRPAARKKPAASRPTARAASARTRRTRRAGRQSMLCHWDGVPQTDLAPWDWGQRVIYRQPAPPRFLDKLAEGCAVEGAVGAGLGAAAGGGAAAPAALAGCLDGVKTESICQAAGQGSELCEWAKALSLGSNLKKAIDALGDDAGRLLLKLFGMEDGTV